MMRLLTLAAFAAIASYAGWVGWLLGYAAPERDRDDRWSQ